MKKRVLAISLIIMVILGIAVAFFFTRPGVAIIEPIYPQGYEINSPAYLSFGYRRVSNPLSASAIIVLPGAELPAGLDGTVIGGPGSDLPIDETRMWQAALSDGVECILYESSDMVAAEIADGIIASDDNAYKVVYDGRISVENIEKILESVSGCDKLLMLTPSSSIRLIRNGSIDADVVMDYRDAAAIEMPDVDEAVAIDWTSTIESVLSGHPELSYALITL